MAHKEMPTVLGKKVEIFVVDNKSDKVEAANAVKRLIEKEKVVAIIGTYGSSLAMAGGEVAEKAGVPMVGTSCTNPLVTQGKKFSFRVCFIDPFQGAGAATYAFKDLKLKTAALLVDISNDYSVGLASFFPSPSRSSAARSWPTKYQAGDQDFGPADRDCKKPDVLFILYFAEGAIIMKQVKELPSSGHGRRRHGQPQTWISAERLEGFVHTTFPYDHEKHEPDGQEVHRELEEGLPGKAQRQRGFQIPTCWCSTPSSGSGGGACGHHQALAVTKEFEGVTGSTPSTPLDAEKPVGLVQIKDGKEDLPPQL
jgi:branched-chain amino acid transport system substrate-binding protein